jgi:hypothetical protein
MDQIPHDGWNGDDGFREGASMASDIVEGEIVDVTDTVRMTNIERVLAAPELLQFEGVYQGPCLLSQESDLEE